jgi:lipoyl(octanoyl) transferase
MRVEHWGLIEYSEALRLQEELVARVASGEVDDTLVFCSHPPVVTVGRSVEPGDLNGWQGSVAEVSRGGRATYHGPGQLVMYPIISLLRDRGVAGLPLRDVHAYLRLLGETVAAVLRQFGLAAEYRQGADGPRHVTGVWVDERKLASIGIAVRRWVTFHGVALNLEPDVAGFSSIRPCGFSAATMGAVSEFLSVPVDRDAVERALVAEFTRRLVCESAIKNQREQMDFVGGSI